MDEPSFAYRKLIVYQKSRSYVKSIYLLTKEYPAEERFALCNQLRRAAVSITSNIAEGLSRFSDKDKVHFLEIAFGSLHETMSQLEISLDLDYISLEDFNNMERQVLDISKMLSGLRKTYQSRIG